MRNYFVVNFQNLLRTEGAFSNTVYFGFYFSLLAAGNDLKS